MKTLINPWKGLKLDWIGDNPAIKLCENPNKSLEGIKTIPPAGRHADQSLVKTLINPWKGLKLSAY